MEKKKLFFGGIHPADKKELTGIAKEIMRIDPDQVVIPLIQHIGAPCKPLVKTGDYVCKGQKIGDGEGLCVPVHASVSGVVSAIEPMPHPNGNKVLSVIIQNDHKDVWSECVKVSESAQNMTAKELFETIREAGIVGMGGAAFPTDVKAVGSYEKIDTLIINACECEPYITADNAQICTEPERILKGAKLLAEILHPERVVLAIEDNKAVAISILKEYLPAYPQITLKVLPTRYPQGAEKQLIQTVTGREVPAGQLPVQVACAVLNVSTVAFISRAVEEGIPLIRRIVTVTGEGVAKPQNFSVPIGTPFSVLIDAAGGLTERCEKVIAGGPMMGKAQGTLEVPVTKATGAVLCLEVSKPGKGTNCIRCGKCLEVCPMHLQPLYMYRYEAAKNVDMLERLNLMDCMECGCCGYVCPAGLPLVESFRSGKIALKEGKTR